MKGCVDIEKRLSSFLEGDLVTDERKLVEDHLSTCRQCSLTLAELQKTIKLLKGMDEKEPPPWLKHKIMTHIREEAQQKKGVLQRLFLPLHIKVPAETFAVCLVAIITVYVYKATLPEIKSLQAPAEQAQSVEYPEKKDKQKAREAPSTATGIKGRKEIAVPESKYRHPSSNATGAGIGAVDMKQNVPEKVLSTVEPPVPQAAPAPSPSSLPAVENKLNSEWKALQPVSPRAGISGSTDKKKESAVSDTTIQYRGKGETDSAGSQLKASAEKKQQSFVITVKTGNVSDAGVEIENFLKLSGAKNLKRFSQENKDVITTELSSQRLKSLFEKLKTAGEVKDSILLLHNITEGEVMLSIEITGNN